MSQRRSGIKVKQAAKPPYTVDEEVIRRYDQKNLIFNRVALDPTWSGHLRSEEEAGLLHMESAEPGYTRTDYALAEASWTLHEGYTDAFGRNRIKRPLGPSLMGTKWYSKKYEVDDSAEMSRIVKRAAKFYGASLVGLTNYKPIWTQANRRYDLTPLEMPEEINRVVVCGVEMDELGIATSPEVPAGAATGLAYSKMSFIGVTLAEFIRNLGYTAVASGNNEGISVPTAIEAGLGQLGRNGLLITPEFGPRVRLLKVYTDLPLEVDHPIEFGVTEFCKGCRKCAEACEVDAISFDEEPSWTPACRSNNPGALKWYVDGEKCFEYWCDNGMDCSTCISVCPFTKGRSEAHSDEFWSTQ